MPLPGAYEIRQLMGPDIPSSPPLRLACLQHVADAAQRPNFGTAGRPLEVFANSFETSLPDSIIHHYDGACLYFFESLYAPSVHRSYADTSSSWYE